MGIYVAAFRLGCGLVFWIWGTIVTMGQDASLSDFSLPKVTHIGVAEGLPARSVFDIVQTPDGFIWLSTDVGIYRYDGYDFVPLREILPVDTELTRQQQRLYVSSAGALLFIHPDTQVTWQYDRSRNQLQRLSIAENEIDSLYRHWQVVPGTPASLRDHQGNTWTIRKSVFWTDECGQEVNYTRLLRQQFSFSKVYRVMEDAQHRIWIATNNGLLTFSNQPKAFAKHLHHAQPQWGKALRGIFSDQHGTIYARVTDKGHSLEKSFFRLDPVRGVAVPFPLYSQQLTSNKTFVNARYYFRSGQSDTVWTINPRGVMGISMPDQSLNIYEDDEHGLHFTNGGARAWTFLPPHHFLVGTELQQLYRYDFRQHQAVPLPVADTLSGRFRLMAMGIDSILWIGTMGDGVYGLDLQNLSVRYAFTPDRYPQLLDPSITTLCPMADGTVWVGTARGGMVHLRPAQNHLQVYTTTDGLANDQVMEILAYANDYLLISTYYGLSLFHIPSQTFRNFYEEDGLSFNEFNVSSAFIDQDGRYYFGGLNGMTSFFPADLLKPIQSPAPVLLTQFSAYDVAHDTLIRRRAPLNNLRKIALNPYISWFQLEFALADYATPQLNQFKVWLEGYQNQWEYLGTQSMIRYNDLPAGRYTLHITGSDSKGFWSEQDVQIDIFVRQVFYKRWWFILLVTLAILGMAYAALRYRFRQKLAQERLRTQIAGDLHDEIGSSLSYVNLFIHSLDTERQAEHVARGILRSREIINKTVSNIRDVIWAIDAGRDTMGDMLDRMEDFALDMLQTKDIAFSFDTADINRNMILRPNVRQNVYLIYKETIHNIVKHAHCTQVHIQLSCTKNCIKLVIQDNGTAIKSTKASGLGLESMRQRAKRLQGEIDIRQNEDGFRVCLEVPV